MTSDNRYWTDINRYKLGQGYKHEAEFRIVTVFVPQDMVWLPCIGQMLYSILTSYLSNA